MMLSRCSLLLFSPQAVLRAPALSLCSLPTGSGALGLFFERPVRALLNDAGPRRMIELPPLADERRPLHSIRALLRTRLSAADCAAVRLAHGKRPLHTDEEVRELLERARTRGHNLKLTVTAAEGARLPPGLPPAAPRLSPADADAAAKAAVGEEAARALAAEPHQMLSFFVFCSPRLSSGRVPLLQLSLRRILAAAGARGTAYVAPEGVNSQLAVPLSQMAALQRALHSLPELRAAPLNVGKVVPAAAGRAAFKKLLVSRREQVLSDGLPLPLDWRRAGVELTPAEWHARLLARREAEGDGALLLDCRNGYESEQGSFHGAAALGTEKFTQSWEALEERLRGVDKATPIMTFCTGGIRCVKVNAYLEQQMGFTNTMRLQDGIHGYQRYIAQQEDATPMWEGHNFVFDSRQHLGITEGEFSSDLAESSSDSAESSSDSAE
ncbi:hypothetical protein AB1Y20_005351 [Prymnesium parvum]|uniref:Rhodanese domain-containing protein n=1 Tax=Prymnesium parvum TaxID=97485 RepID=A0AB34J3X2_PRYPA